MSFGIFKTKTRIGEIAFHHRLEVAVLELVLAAETLSACRGENTSIDSGLDLGAAPTHKQASRNREVTAPHLKEKPPRVA